MEPATIALIVTSCVSAFLIASRFIKRIRNSSCTMTEDKITIDISTIETHIEKSEELTEDEKEKAKKVIKKLKK